jgi:hypothetical protein
MKPNLLIATIALLSGSLLAADSDTKDAVTNAAKKLAEQPNYSWKATTENAGGGGGGGGGGRGFRPGPTEGKTEKGGYTLLTMSRGQNNLHAVLKGDKGALETQEGWQSLSEAAEAQGDGGGGGGRGGRGRFMARMLQNYKTPAVEAEDLIAKTKDLKESDGVYSGDLTSEAVKSLMRFGGRGGGGNVEITGAKGTAKFWVKDGVLSKFQYHVQGTVSFNGNDRDIDRTTTVEISDVGSTKVSVPAEAEKKL